MDGKVGLLKSHFWATNRQHPQRSEILQTHTQLYYSWNKQFSRDLSSDQGLELYLANLATWERITPAKEGRADCGGWHASSTNKHQGIGRFARSYVWWSGLDVDLEERVRKCLECQRGQKVPPKSLVNSGSCFRHPGADYTSITLDLLEIKHFSLSCAHTGNGSIRHCHGQQQPLRRYVQHFPPTASHKRVSMAQHSLREFLCN